MTSNDAPVRKTPKGGARKGAGRKPSAATILKRKIAEHGVAEADFAFALQCTVMRDTNQPWALRLEAAKEVQNRVLGKPATTVNLNRAPVEIIGFNYGDAITAIAPGPIPNHDDTGGNVGGGHGPAVGENAHGGE